MRHQSLHIKVLITGLLFQMIQVPCLKGQSLNKIDSLINRLQVLKEDTNKVNTYLRLSRELAQSGNLSNAATQLEAAMSLSHHLKYALGIARSYNNAGSLKMRQNNPAMAYEDFKAALNHSIAADNKNEMAVSYSNIGLSQSSLGNLSEAYTQYLKAYELMDQLNDQEGMIKCNNRLSEIQLMQGNNESASELLLQNIQLESQLSDEQAMAQTYNSLGRAHNQMGKLDDALTYYDQSLVLAEKYKMKSTIASVNFGMGMNYYARSDYSKALEKFAAALAMFEELNNRNGIAASYSAMANVYYDLGNYTTTIKYHLDALRINEQTGNKLNIAAGYSNIANVYVVQGRYEEARQHQLNSLKLHQEIGNKTGMANNYYNLSVIALNIQDPQSGLDHILSALALNEDIGDQQGVAWCYLILGDSYSQLGHVEKALASYTTCLACSEKVDDRVNLARCLNALGVINKDLNKNEEARKYIQQSISLFKELGVRESLRNAYYTLFQIDSMSGNYDNALKAHLLYTLYKDSLSDEAHNQLTAEMESKYETEKKDREIQKLNNERQIHELQITLQHDNLSLLEAERGRLQTANLFNLQQVKLLDREKQLQSLELEKKEASNLIQQSEIEKNNSQLALMNKESEIQRMEIKKQRLLKNYFMGGILLFGFLSFFAYNYYVTKQKLKLQVLRNKIASDLHDDVGSTLSSISIFSEMAKEQSKETIPMLETIGESSRKMLDAMADIVWTINPENDQLERILLKMRSFAYELLGAKKIAFKFTADDHISHIKLPMEVRKNLYLIFKEAANNMAKYSGADKAFFSLKEEKGYLTMMIRDNGKGFDPVEETTGNGIKNMRKRAEEIRALLQINSSPGEGTFIELKVAI